MRIRVVVSSYLKSYVGVMVGNLVLVELCNNKASSMTIQYVVVIKTGAAGCAIGNTWAGISVYRMFIRKVRF